MRQKQVVLMLLAVLLTGMAARAQEKPAEERQAPVPLTVTVVFSEFEGEKKISSLPYTLPVNAERGKWGSRNLLRMGVRVPVMSSDNPNAVRTVHYMDVGTNLDCRAMGLENGQFEVELQVERSSIYSVGAEGRQVEWQPSERLGIAAQPIVRQYGATMQFLMRDGQTIQRSMATDPLSGRVLKVDVMLNVVK